MKWEKKRIRDFAIVFDGPHATPYESNIGPIFLGIKNMKPEGGIDLTDIRHISDSEYEKWTKRVTPKKDDIVLSYEATLHRYAIIPDSFIGCLGRRMALVRVNQNQVCHKFIYYTFLSDAWRGFIDANKLTGATVDRISITDFPDYKINLPPLPTQHKIASILSAYDDLIENNLKRIKLLEEKAFSSFKLLDKVFKYKLSDLYDTSSGGTPSRTNSDYFTGEINWFKSKELADSILLESEEKITETAVEKSSAKLFPTGSVIMAMYGATIGKLGLLSMPSTTNQACCAIIEKDQINSNFYILNWLLENREYVLSFRMGAAQENISQQVIKNLIVSMPNDSDLKYFNFEMKPIYQLIKNLQQQNVKLCVARDILLPKLMNGQLEV
jgi:type I restriction enzyme S subunit